MSFFSDLLSPQQQKPQPAPQPAQQQQQFNWLPLMSQAQNALSQYDLERQQQPNQKDQKQNPLHYGPIGLAEGGPVQAGGQQGLTFEEATSPQGLSFEEARGSSGGEQKIPTMDLIKTFIREHLPNPPLPHSITGEVLGDIKAAPRAAMDLTQSDPSLYKAGQSGAVDPAAGAMLGAATLGTSVPSGLLSKTPGIAERVAAANALKARTPLGPRPEAPTPQELIGEARQGGYAPAETQAAARPIHPDFRDLTTQEWRNNLRQNVGTREERNPETFGHLKNFEKIEKPDVGDLINLRLNLRDTRHEAATKILEPQVMQHMETLSPGIQSLIENADKNYSAGMIGERFGEGVERKQMQRAGQVGDRLHDLAAQMLTGKDSRYIAPGSEAERALQDLAAKTGQEHILHNVGRVGGALHWGMAGLTGLFRPEALALPIAGTAARMGYNRSMLARAGETAARLAANSPMHQARQAAYQAGLAARQQGSQSSSQAQRALGILARPAAAGILQQQ